MPSTGRYSGRDFRQIYEEGAAKEFYEREGHLAVPVKFVTEDGIRLGAWLQKKASERERLLEDMQALEKIGMLWGGKYDAKWDEKLQLAEQYYQEHSNLEVPKEYTVQGVKLGRWISALRSALTVSICDGQKSHGGQDIIWRNATIVSMAI